MPVRGLEPALEVLSKSRDPGDRAAAVTARCSLDPESVEAHLRSGDPLRVRAAGAALLLAGDGALDAAREQLERSSDAETLSALGVALNVNRVRDRIPSHRLVKWLVEGSVLGPLAALALSERQEPGSEERLDALLESPDPLFRSAAARGLGSRTAHDATGRLTEMYWKETSAEVRRSIIASLAARQEAPARRVLEFAAELDPDAEVRALSRAPLPGAAPVAPSRGNGVLFVPVAFSEAPKRPRSAALLVSNGSGFLASVWVAPDGVALLFGLPSGTLDGRAILPPALERAP
jgi:hypothetical protein